MPNSLVSILMPVYRTELGLRKEMDSMLNQTFADLKHIVINDNSPDDAKTILDLNVFWLYVWRYAITIALAFGLLRIPLFKKIFA
ncbi:MAG: glycosyltransferase [Bacteroidales bacterium]|nr:glycosyltransferase [Bacteroidales bacterium]